MKIYLDTSALITVYVPEEKTIATYKFLTQLDQSVFLSRLTEAEFFSALAKKARNKSTPKKLITNATDLFQKHVSTYLYRHLHLTDEIFSLAINFIRTKNTNLRTLDALHLAMCANNHATLVTADVSLAKSAKALKQPVKLV